MTPDWKKRIPREIWLREFARNYADVGRCGLFEAKRVAEYVFPYMQMLRPETAARQIALDPDLNVRARSRPHSDPGDQSGLHPSNDPPEPGQPSV